jgi:Xaa-Pro aminopeptidase
LIRQTRMVKSMWEIEQIRAACRMGLEIFEFVPRVLCQQMWEIELAGSIERFSRQLGHPGYIRTRGFNQEMTYTTVLSGPEAATSGYGSEPLGGRGVAPAFPHGSTHRLIGKNEPVIVDFVAWAGGYVADMTRTYCIGKLPSHMEHAYDTAMAIQDLLKKEARAGAVCGELWTAVRQLVRTNGLCEHFMGMARRVSFIAHGVGVEVDELPVLSPRNEMVLQPNMVIAVEPKFVFPDGAVGLENTFVVGPEGLVSLIESQDGVYILHEH